VEDVVEETEETGEEEDDVAEGEEADDAAEEHDGTAEDANQAGEEASGKASSMSDRLARMKELRSRMVSFAACETDDGVFGNVSFPLIAPLPFSAISRSSVMKSYLREPRHPPRPLTPEPIRRGQPSRFNSRPPKSQSHGERSSTT